MYGVYLNSRKASAELNSRLGIECITDLVKTKQTAVVCVTLMWFGHVEIQHSDDWVSARRSLKLME